MAVGIGITILKRVKQLGKSKVLLNNNNGAVIYVGANANGKNQPNTAHLKCMVFADDELPAREKLKPSIKFNGAC
ncbi:hypothetical protein ACOBV8_20995 (plasmid) [Pseudoalteromonas espejiana]